MKKELRGHHFDSDYYPKQKNHKSYFKLSA